MAARVGLLRPRRPLITKKMCNRVDVWATFIRRSGLCPTVNHGHVHEQHGQLEIMEHYSGKVYCCEVPTHIMYVRKNGKPVWCGNSDRHSAKGIIADVIPDDSMPRAGDGQPIDMILNPIGVPSRMNVSQIWDALAGKVAAKTGKPIEVLQFGQDNFEFINSLLSQNKVTDVDDVYDPRTGKTNKVMTGIKYTYKLNHPVMKKFSVRQRDGYSVDQQPLKISGSHKSAKSGGAMEVYALMAHGADHFLEDSVRRSSYNPTFWAAFESGLPLPPPKPTYANQQLINYLKAAGVNVESGGDRVKFSPMLDRHVNDISAGAIKNPGVIKSKNLQPEPGGLFDEVTTGGLQGCLHGSMKVLTENGLMPIAEIVENRLSVNVYSFDFAKEEFVLKPVTNWFINKSEDGLGRFEFDNTFNNIPNEDSRLWLTGNHKIMLRDGGYIRADLAKSILQVEYWPSDQQLSPAGSQWPQDIKGNFRLTDVKIKFNSTCDHEYCKTRRVYDIEVADTHNYIANGILVSNSNWTSIDLKAPVVHPLYEDFIHNVLSVLGHNPVLLSGTEIKAILSKVSSKEILKRISEKIQSSSVPRNSLLKAVKAVRAAIKNDLNLADFVITKIPVLPPMFRPIYPLPDGSIEESPINKAYKNLLLVNQLDTKLMSGQDKKEFENKLKDAVGEVIGMHDIMDGDFRSPRGAVSIIKGKRNKSGLFQNKLLSRRMDYTAQAVAVPNYTLGINEVGLPEDIIWGLYAPHIMRKLSSLGTSPVNAKKAIEERSTDARRALDTIMADTPVVLNRAPTLHKFSMMAFYPKIVGGNAIQTNPLINEGYNLDHDGDSIIGPIMTRDCSGYLRWQNIRKLQGDQLIIDHDAVKQYSVKNFDVITDEYDFATPTAFSTHRLPTMYII
jgi:hypothetical protein